MLLLGSDPVFPAWVVLPMAVVALVATCLHLMLMQGSAMPASRKRIRTTSGVLSLFLIPLAAYGFGVATMNDQRVFLLVWLSVLGLLAILVILAAVDMMNNVRIHASERRQIRHNLRVLRAELNRHIQQRRSGG